MAFIIPPAYHPGCLSLAFYYYSFFHWLFLLLAVFFTGFFNRGFTPLQFGIITAKGISKKNAWEEIIRKEGTSFDELLGVGDSTSDWQFIQLCKYASAMGNASKESKELVQSKGKEFSYIAPSVDENGIIGIFKHFRIM